MSQISEEYRHAITRMTGPERVTRSIGMFEDMVKILAHKIERTQPHLSPREVRRDVALRLYRNDRGVQELLRNLEL